MGIVYAATDTDNGEAVAVKVLHPAVLSSENLKRFRREVKAAASLRHKNICQVLRHGLLDDRTPYIAMELLKGDTLRGRMREEGALALPDAISIAIQLLDAVGAAHARGVLHRDIKPGNVFLTNAPNAAPVVKLIDFGLAKLLPSWKPNEPRSEDSSVITDTGIIAGTPQYLSPEQLVGKRDLDERADVWAVGVVTYEMMTGRRPFDAATHHALAAAIALDPPKGIRFWRNDVSPDVEAVVLAGALAKERKDRYASADVFRQALLWCWARVRAEGLVVGSLLRSGKVSPRHSQPPDSDTDVNLPLDESPSSAPTARRRYRH
jgi:serine/threonine-protein kinase